MGSNNQTGGSLMAKNDFSTPAHRLLTLRQAMKRHDIDIWWLPSSDPHCSEYLPGYWAGREWLSGFDGSVGTLVITQQDAGLWVDSRYWEQATRQLAGSGITLMKLLPDQPDAAICWVVEQLAPGQTLGFDAEIVSWSVAQSFKKMLSEKDVRLCTDFDLLNDVWLSRPLLPNSNIYAHERRYVDEAPIDRLDRIRQFMDEKNVDYHLISSLDDVAWITQLRGCDVNYNPLFISHIMIGRSCAKLFTSVDRVNNKIKSFLLENGIDVAEYDQWLSHVSMLPSGSTVFLDPKKISFATRKAIPSKVEVMRGCQPSTIDKGTKSARDIQNIRNVMEQDGVALCETFSWLEEKVCRGERVTEWDVDQKLLATRSAREGFVSRSFGTMCGFNANGAQPHYQPSATSHATIDKPGLLLVDSGAHYQGGTTDITRMISIGKLGSEQCESVTLVLKGLIALSRARFPHGLPSPFLDPLARAPLWAHGRDYGHGTGHGVGYFLNVHEGPQSIAWYTPPEKHTIMQPGMITSIEPGQYHPGKWGARLENLVVTHVCAGYETKFLEFETLSLCPFDMRCIDRELLDVSEIDWINSYHKMVRQRLAPFLSGNPLTWLMERTATI